MKKYIVLISILLAGLFSSCDYNERNFEGLDEMDKPSGLVSLDYVVTDADISIIVAALRAEGKTETAEILNADKMFSEAAPASGLIPYVLSNKNRYPVVDIKSSAAVKYKYKSGRNETVSGLTGPGYKLGDSDYKLVWGDLFASALTPAKSPGEYLPKVLKAGVSSPAEGSFETVEYFYSEEEPVTTIVEGETLWTEKFDGQTKDTPISLTGWLNAKVAGNRTWDAKSFNNNFYAQMSSNGSKEVNDIWLITPRTDLSVINNPHLIFQVKIGYYNADCLTVLVSEDFDGNEANISSAKWDNITDKFTIPQEPANGYGADFVSSGLGSLDKYKGKNIYVAFRYQGDDTTSPKKTTTYQLDDIKICEAVVGIEVEEKKPFYASYTYEGEAWKKTGDNIITLQPADYAEMGLSSGTMSTTQAPNYLPIWLKSEYPYAQDGDVKTVVYKTNAADFYADECIYNNEKSTWIINSFIEEKIDQFVYSTTGWVFDPTIIVDMQDANGKAEYQVIVDYVKTHQAIENPALSIYADSEYYYGFAGRYQNISYRDKDRSADPLYPLSGSTEEKEDFLDARTVEGLQLYLTLRYPDAQPNVSGITQLAEIRVNIYSSRRYNNDNEIWTYTFECTGNKEWKFIKRVSQFGTVEEAVAE